LSAKIENNLFNPSILVIRINLDTAFYHVKSNDTNVAKDELKVTVIFPAKNEEGTIENTVLMASVALIQR
jgi:hypothetical protein